MEKTFQIRTHTLRLLADTLTPVSIYLKIRDQFPNCVLLESSDFKSSQNSFSFIGIKPIASFKLEDKTITETLPHEKPIITPVTSEVDVPQKLADFAKRFQVVESDTDLQINGLFGYCSYDAVQYFENIQFSNKISEKSKIPDIYYSFYKYIICIDHFKNELTIVENLIDGKTSKINRFLTTLASKNFASYGFDSVGDESSNITNQEYIEMVKRGKEHCHRGNVFQIVVSRQFSQQFQGDDFNLYRALRSINPSPYLFYFDYGNFKIFGSSPEAQILVKENKATINPIAGTFRRTGDDKTDRKLAEQLCEDPKENAEHVMLVDLARNDLSRNSDKVKVEEYREVEFYSHVIHLVSKVTGNLPPDTNTIKIMADSFPAGTLSGAPKYKAMQLIDEYENQNRGYYGGCIGYIGLDGEINTAIMIRSFLSKNNQLFYQAGAGIVADSVPEKELQEVNNKLAALKRAIQLAKDIS